MSSLFGGSKSKQTSTSNNQAFDQIKSTFSPATAYAGQGGDAIAALLGGDATGFNNYKDATGFDFLSQQGSRGITGNAAAGGLLRSGSTAKSLVDYGNNMQNQYSQDYLKNLLGLSGLGMQAGGLISGAGQQSNSTSKSSSKPGVGGFLGAAMSGIAASDRRLKTDIDYRFTLDNGLNVYSYTYIHTGKRVMGVMADEVRTIMPEALGPKMFGYDTVDYDVIRSRNRKG